MDTCTLKYTNTRVSTWYVPDSCSRFSFLLCFSSFLLLFFAASCLSQLRCFLNTFFCGLHRKETPPTAQNSSTGYPKIVIGFYIQRWFYPFSKKTAKLKWILCTFQIGLLTVDVWPHLKSLYFNNKGCNMDPSPRKPLVRSQSCLSLWSLLLKTNIDTHCWFSPDISSTRLKAGDTS